MQKKNEDVAHARDGIKLKNSRIQGTCGIRHRQQWVRRATDLDTFRVGFLLPHASLLPTSALASRWHSSSASRRRLRCDQTCEWSIQRARFPSFECGGRHRANCCSGVVLSRVAFQMGRSPTLPGSTPLWNKRIETTVAPRSY